MGRVPRGGRVPKVGFPVRPKICALSQRWRQGRLQVHFPGGNQAQVPGKAREVWPHLPSPEGSWSNSCTWKWIGHQAINGLDEGVWNREVGDLGTER